MAFSSEDSGGGFSEPNVVPMVDVMLVLLIIFMVTSMVAHNVHVRLPQATIERPPVIANVPPVAITVRENGDLFWNDELLTDRNLLDSRLSVEAQRTPQPDVLLRADATTRYELIQGVVTSARVAGMRSINFATVRED